MSEDSKTVSQQPVEEAKKPEDNRVIKCGLSLTLIDGNQFSTEMLIPVKTYDQVRDNIAASLTNQKGEGILTLCGSFKSPFDWSHISVKSIIMTNMNFIEMLEPKEDESTT